MKEKRRLPGDTPGETWKENSGKENSGKENCGKENYRKENYRKENCGEDNYREENCGKESAEKGTAEKEIVLSGRDIVKCYRNHAGEPFYALRHVDIDIVKKELTILRGRSGSGKTTLLNMLSGLDLPDSGTVTFQGQVVSPAAEQVRERLRRTSVGYIFQAVALIPIMNSYENVEFALRLAGYQGDYKQRVEECLSLVGLKDRMYHMPAEMSGGEQQRVAIARAIAHKPSLIFADEPTAELDTQTAFKVIHVLRELTRQEDISIIMTTHDAGLFDAGDVCYEMEDGRIVGAYDTV